MKWLFLVHQVQTSNSRERVKVWRLTKQVGALLYRNSVYVLPYTKECLEDFQWLCQEIRDSKGEASVFVSEAKDAAEDNLLQEHFVKSREQEYLALEKEVRDFTEQHDRADRQNPFTPTEWKKAERDLRQIEAAFEEIKRIDFFHHPSGSKIERSLHKLRAGITHAGVHPEHPIGTLKFRPRSEFQSKVWVTRPHIHIDRLCSAWLIKRFIDPKARFTFASEDSLPKNAIPFDVFGVEFSHQGDRCTFETLMEVFRLRDKALSSLAELVHEIDLKDEKYHRPEAPGLDIIVRSISDSLGDDQKTLALWSHILDALYERLSSSPKGRQ